jgi:hypothetical protein
MWIVYSVYKKDRQHDEGKYSMEHRRRVTVGKYYFVVGKLWSRSDKVRALLARVRGVPRYRSQNTAAYWTLGY